ncbi:MAG: hypothetical protein IJ131_09535 [Eggerthellaceae bacterium]|nr:hypothetical protein [Eggerthellaceae bacterium]
MTCLLWDEHTNNVAAKGAYAPLDAQFSWAAGGDEFIYVDPNASTADTIVGYAYSVFGSPVSERQPVTLTLYTCDVPFNQDFTEDQFHMQTYEIPCTNVATSMAFASDEGSTISLSPLGLVLERRALFVQPSEPGGYDMAQDPVNVRRIAVKLDDGTAYTVFDKAQDLDNTLSACGFDTNLVVVFNRLAYPAHVESIEVAVTDAKTMEDLVVGNGEWPTDANWPVRTITYRLSWAQ